MTRSPSLFSRVGLLASSVTTVALLSGAGCKKSAAVDQAPLASDAGVDPAAANLAPVSGSGSGSSTGQPAQVMGYSQTARGASSGESYPQQAPTRNESLNPAGPAPVVRQAPAGQAGQYGDPYSDSDVNAGYDALDDQQPVYADQAPPPLPEYQQPALTEANDEWTPGYWDYGTGGYYWVPGAWVAPPHVGALWTPGYWGYYNNRYRWHHGFWGSHIGFYGGVPYGFGYTGYGYAGGYWHGNDFFYNRQVNRIDVERVRNVYIHNVTVVNNQRISYNGGPGGWNVRPRPAEIAAYREQRLPPMQTQVAFRQQAAANRGNFFAENHGRPAEPVAARFVAADRTPPQAVERGGFGQQAGRPGFAGGAPGQPQMQQRGLAEQQRGQVEQQRQQQMQQQNEAQRQQNQQRQGNQQQAQQNQAERDRNQQLQQRGQVEQPRQQAEQQRQQGEQQRQQQTQQRNEAQRQQNQAQAQQNQQRQQQTQQRSQMDQQRNQAEQQRQQQIQQRNQVEQQRPQQVQPRVQPQAVPPPRPEAAPAPRPQPAPAPHPQAAPAPHPQAAPAAPHGGGGEPHGGGGEHPHR